MSLGYAPYPEPLTEEEIAAQQAAGAAPPALGALPPPVPAMPGAPPAADAAMAPGAAGPGAPPPDESILPMADVVTAPPSLTGPAPLPKLAAPALNPGPGQLQHKGVSASMAAGQLSPELQANLVKQQDLSERNKEAIRAGGTEKVETAKAEVQNAEAEKQYQAERLQRMATAQAQGDQMLEAARRDYQAKVKAYQDLGPGEGAEEAYWKTHSKVASFVGIALGVLGSALSGGRQNEALQLVESRIKQYGEMKRAEIGRAKESALMSRTGVTSAAEARANLLKEIDAKEAALWAGVKAQAQATLKARGVPAAEQETNALVIKADMEQAKIEGQALAPTVQHVTSSIQRSAQDPGFNGEPAVGGSLAAISQYIKDHPADQPGAYQAAEAAGYKGTKAAALVDKLQNDYKAAKGEDDNTLVRDEKGRPIGHVPTGRGGAQGFATRDADYGRAQEQLEKLAADIKEHGGRVFLPEAVKRRAALKHNADIAVATVSPLGKTDEAMKAEQASIGESGAYTLVGANPEALANKIRELKEQRDRYRKETLVPLKERPAPDETAPSAAPTARVAAGRLKAFGKLAPEDQAAVKWARAHRSDPRAAEILQHNGM